MAIPLHAFVTTRFDTHRWPESIPVAGASLVEGHDGFANILNCRCPDRAHIAVAGRAVTARRLLAMKRILLTGMSGTGKSSVIHALADLGYKAIDTDEGWCEQLPDGRQRWP
jgi:hypothetical protein